MRLATNELEVPVHGGLALVLVDTEGEGVLATLARAVFVAGAREEVKRSSRDLQFTEHKKSGIHAVHPIESGRTNGWLLRVP